MKPNLTNAQLLDHRANHNAQKALIVHELVEQGQLDPLLWPLFAPAEKQALDEYKFRQGLKRKRP